MPSRLWGWLGNGPYKIPQLDKNGKLSSMAVPASKAYAATGTNSITIITSDNFLYNDGNIISFKAAANNTGNVTINIDDKGALPLKKMSGAEIPAGGVKSGYIYEACYSVANSCFFLLARADGDAVAGDVLANKIFSSNGDVGLTGIMPNRGAATITPSTSNQSIAAGYHNGSGYVVGDSDLIASNIRSGKNLFGVNGSLVEGIDFNGASTSVVIGELGGAVNTITKVSVNGSGVLLACVGSYDNTSNSWPAEIIVDGVRLGSNSGTWFYVTSRNVMFVGVPFATSLVVKTTSPDWLDCLYTLN